MEAIAVLVARIFAAAVTDGLVLIAPHRQTSIDAVLVGVDHRAFDDHSLNDRLDRFLLHIGQHAAGQSHMKNLVGGSTQRNPYSEQRNAPTRVPLRSGTLDPS